MVALLTFFACTVHVHVYSGYVISFQSMLYVHSTYIVRIYKHASYNNPIT